MTYAANRSCDRITHSGALWEGPLSKGEGARVGGGEREAEVEKHRREHRRRKNYPWTLQCPLPLFQLSCIHFFFFAIYLGGCAFLPLFERWPQWYDAAITLFHNLIEQKTPQSIQVQEVTTIQKLFYFLKKDDVSSVRALKDMSALGLTIGQ